MFTFIPSRIAALCVVMILLPAWPALAQCTTLCTGPTITIDPVDGTYYPNTSPYTLPVRIHVEDPNGVDVSSATVLLLEPNGTRFINTTATVSSDGTRALLRTDLMLTTLGNNVLRVRVADRSGNYSTVNTTYELDAPYWLSIADASEQPLPLAGTLEVDLPLQEQRSVYVGVVIPRAAEWASYLCGKQVSAQVTGDAANFVSIAREVRTATGEQRVDPGQTWSRYTPPANPQSVGISDSVVIKRFNAPTSQCLDSTPIQLDTRSQRTRPAEYRLWLQFTSGATAGTHTGTLTLNVHGWTMTVALKLTIWPVLLPATSRPSDFHGYGDVMTWANGYAVTPETVPSLNVKLDAYVAAGGNVLSIGGATEMVTYLKIASTGQQMPVPYGYSVDALPDIDFSYYDPVFDASRRKVKRIEVYTSLLPHTFNDRFPLTLLKQDPNQPLRVVEGSADHKKVLRWWLAQLKAYLLRRGFTEQDGGFFCKIGDEMGPEHIAAYNETAEVVRQAGWRPFTSFIPPISQSSEYLNELLPQVDRWRMGFISRDMFRKFTTESYRLEWKQVKHTSGWSQYTNGSADTWQHDAIYGRDAAGRALVPQSDRTLILQPADAGVSIPVYPGRSPWGNQELNLALPHGATLYASRADGLTPTGSELKVRYNNDNTDIGNRRVWNDVTLGFHGIYGNGGARDTGAWSMGSFNYDAAANSNLDQFLVLQKLSSAGAPLRHAGQYPWGNRKRGVFYRSGSWIWASLHDGREPGSLLTVRYSKPGPGATRIWTDRPLSTVGQYVNGGAVDTWQFPLPAEALAADVDQILVLQNVAGIGLPLEQHGGSPWGNRLMGISILAGATGYVSRWDGESPNGATMTVRYRERIPDALNGKVLLTLKKDEATQKVTDETWFYAGLEHTFATPYATMQSYALLAAVEKPHGFSVFAFNWWNDNRVLWLDGAAVLSTGPAYAGLRDGWRDALLIDYAVRTRQVATMDQVASISSAALLPLTFRTFADDASVTFSDFSDLGHPRVNAARRELLRRLSQ